jgi:hypothetical protein
MKAFTVLLILAALVASSASAHHNPVVYDGKITVKITGIVTAAHYGYPHSRYALDVTNEDGIVEKWLLMTEDPKDAQQLGFAAELKAIAVGDTLTAVGWPNKIKAREIRGHQLHYADGRVVMMRRGNYRWTNDLKKIWRLRSGQDEFDPEPEQLAASLSDVDRVQAWIDEDDAVARIAFEIMQESATLIGIQRGEAVEFPGVDDLFSCHTQREDFRVIIDIGAIDAEDRDALLGGDDYIDKYNDLLSRYWEYDIASC